MLTDVDQMLVDLEGGETRKVEFKVWVDIAKGASAIKIARSIAALSNSGGGRIYFGIDDSGRPLPHSSEFPLAGFSAEAIHTLLRKHVGELECRVLLTQCQGVQYPVVHVPKHGDVPWLAPDNNGQLDVFIRSIKPEVVTPQTRQQWDELLESVLAVRHLRDVQRLEDGLVSRSQEIARLVAAELKNGLTASGPADLRPNWELIRSLAEDTRRDFIGQLNDIVIEGDPARHAERHNLVRSMLGNNVVDGYALLDVDDNLVPVDTLMETLRSASSQMMALSYRGWSDFITLSDPRSSPRAKYWEIGKGGVTGVEGAKLGVRDYFTSSLDYWRAYANGVFTICRSFDEDSNTDEDGRKFLTTNMSVIRIHSIVAHAATIIGKVPDVASIAVFSYPVGMQSRPLRTSGEGDFQVLGSGVGSDTYPFEMIVNGDELRSDYLGSLTKVLNGVVAPYADRIGSRSSHHARSRRFSRSFRSEG